MDSEDPDTWYKNPGSYGIMAQFFHHPALGANRESRRAHKAFAQVWNTADLWVSVDRVSFNPPERDGWRFAGPHLHWDTSLALPIPFDVSGLLYLTDTSAEQGAFTCVPGFQRRIADWLKSLPPDADPRRQDLRRLGAVPVPGKAGDLVIWHQALPHGSRPNTAVRPRIVQLHHNVSVEGGIQPCMDMTRPELSGREPCRPPRLRHSGVARAISARPSAAARAPARGKSSRPRACRAASGWQDRP